MSTFFKEFYFISVIQFSSLLRAQDQTKPYPVSINPDLVSRIENCLKDLNIAPVNPRTAQPIKAEQSAEPHISLLVISNILYSHDELT